MTRYFSFSNKYATKFSQSLNRNPLESHFISPGALSYLRLGSSLFIFLTLLINFLTPQPATNLILHLTNFNYYGLTAYIWTATYLSFFYANKPVAILASRTKLYKFNQYQFPITLIINTIVTISYFGFVAKDDLVPNMSIQKYFLSICMHGINSIIVYTELIFTKNIIPIRALPLTLGILGVYFLYVIFFQIIFQIQAYPFLNYNENPLLCLGIILGILFINILVFVFSYLLCNLRDQLVLRLKRNVSTLDPVTEKTPLLIT